MNPHSAASAYKEALFENAPPLKIVHMLYEGAIRFLAQAEQIDPLEEPAPFAENLRRADRIVAELRLSLDHDQAPELCSDLNALYIFAEKLIQDALLDRTTEPLAEATEILNTLLEGWKSIQMSERLAS